MPFGCFGKRKKKDKTASSNSANAAPGSDHANSNAANDNKLQPQEVKEEAITVARTQSLLASATPNSTGLQPGSNIQKSATLARYDFLKKSEYANSADRWAALKQQYLVPKMTQSQHSDAGQQAKPSRTAQSLPRQFSPPSTVVSAVKFSQWFYDRQIKEEEARQEAHERELKSKSEESAAALAAEQQHQQQQQKQRQQQQEPANDAAKQVDNHQPEPASEAQVADSVDDIDLNDPQLNDAAVKIQAGFKGMQARKEVEQMQQNQQDEQPNEQQSAHASEEQNGSLNEQDPELNAAAVKIQAGFKGYKARKQIQQQQHSGTAATAAAAADENGSS